MDSIIFEIKDQIYQTIKLASDFFKNFNLATLLLSFGLFYIIFLRTWPLKKISSFILSLFLLFILMIRTESLLTNTLGPENSEVPLGICRVVAAVLASVIFIYNAAIRD